MWLSLDQGAEFFKKHLFLISFISLPIALAVIFFLLAGSTNPLPAAIKQQLSYPVIYPTASRQIIIDKSSYHYQSDQKILTYIVSYNGTKVVLSVQSAAGNSQDASLVYYQSLGLRPVGQIQTKLGLAVLVNFYATDNFASVGQDAILAKSGTLTIAHPEKNLTFEAWKDFINNLNISK